MATAKAHAKKPPTAKQLAARRTKRTDWTPEKRGGRPISSLRGPIRELAERLGGAIQLAAAIGVAPRSVRRWCDGTYVPGRPTRLLLAALAHLHGVEPPFATTEEYPIPKWFNEPIEEDNDP